MATCDSDSSSSSECEGCDAAPLAPAVAHFNKISIKLAPIGGSHPGVAVYKALLGLIKFDTAGIREIRTSTKDGECSMQPKDADEPCGEKECKEKTPCELDIAIDFYPYNYVRFPFWNGYEDIKLPNGKTVSYKRYGNLRTITYNHKGECGKGATRIFNFENGIISQSLSCNSCEGSSGN